MNCDAVLKDFYIIHDVIKHTKPHTVDSGMAWQGRRWLLGTRSGSSDRGSKYLISTGSPQVTESDQAFAGPYLKMNAVRLARDSCSRHAFETIREYSAHFRDTGDEVPRRRRRWLGTRAGISAERTEDA